MRDQEISFRRSANGICGEKGENFIIGESKRNCASEMTQSDIEHKGEPRTIDIVTNTIILSYGLFFNEVLCLLSLQLLYCATITIIAILSLILLYIAITFAREVH